MRAFVSTGASSKWSRPLAAAAVALALAGAAGAEWVWDGELGWIDMAERPAASDRGLYAYARGLFIRGDYAAALATFEEVEKTFPESAYAFKAKFGGARCEARLGQLLRAIEITDDLLKARTPQVPVEQVVAFQLITLEALGQFDPRAAAAPLGALVEKAPTRELKAKVRVAEGKLRFQLREYEKARRAYRGAFDVETEAGRKNEALFQAALCDLIACRESGHDETRVSRAQDGFQALEKAYTTGERAETLKQYLWIIDRVLDTSDPKARQIYYAVTYLAERRYEEAYDQFKRAAKKFRGTPAGETARFFQSECLYFQERHWKAFRTYERFMTQYPDTHRARDAAEREFAVAEKLREQGRRGKAIAAYEAVTRNFPSGPLADDAQMRAGMMHLRAERYDDAKAAFDVIVTDYTQSEWFTLAVLRGGEADLKNSVFASNNDELLAQARRSFELVLRDEPKGERAERAKALRAVCDERQARAKWLVARFYERRKQPRAAAEYYRMLVRNHPQSSLRGKAEELLLRYSTDGLRLP